MEDDDPFVSRLKMLTPSAAAVDPIAAAFAAGRKSTQGRTRIWQGASAACLVLCGVAWWAGGNHAGRGAAEVAPGRAVATNAEPMAPLSDESEFRLQRAVLEHGVDGLDLGHSTTIERIDVPGAL